jgi:hypothetical protein
MASPDWNGRRTVRSGSALQQKAKEQANNMSGKKTTTRLGLIGPLAVVAIIAMAVGASAAFGFSEFKFASGGKFPINFHGVNAIGGLATFTTEKGATIMCKDSLTNGAVESSTAAKFTATYTGDCLLQNTPPKVGEGACTEPIKTEELKAEPITLSNGNKRGLLIQPAKAGGIVAQFTCGSVKVKVEGGVICEDEPNTGKPATTGKVICSQGSKTGEQEFTSGEALGGTVSGISLTAEATDLFTFTEKDSQATKEEVSYSAAIEQT